MPNAKNDKCDNESFARDQNIEWKADKSGSREKQGSIEEFICFKDRDWEGRKISVWKTQEFET